MKTALLAGLLLAAAAPAWAQEAAEPFKGANALLLPTSDSASVAYAKVANALLAAGYSLERSDKELGFLATKARPAPRYNMLYSMQVAVLRRPAGAVVQTSGNFSLPGAAAVSAVMAGESRIEYRGGAASTYMICWQAMRQAVQAAYPGVAPAYTRLP